MPSWLIALLLFLGIGALYALRIQKSPSYQQAPVTTSVKHLGVIMDGNRRWARKNNLSLPVAYRKGIDALQTTADYCLAHNISMLTAYAFSLENFQRDPKEVQGVFEQFAKEAHTALPSLKERRIAVRFIGDPQVTPTHLVPLLKDLEEQTKQNPLLHLNVLFCYGGRQEIQAAVAKIVNDVLAGTIKTAPSETEFKHYLWTGVIPDPDLVIRTGGCKRLSNFMPYQTTYSELYFIDHLWPDITIEDLDNALRHYAQCNRTTFGT